MISTFSTNIYMYKKLPTHFCDLLSPSRRFPVLCVVKSKPPGGDGTVSFQCFPRSSGAEENQKATSIEKLYLGGGNSNIFDFHPYLGK